MLQTIDDQAVCDFCDLFIDVDCRWPVGVYDAKVFGNSFISQKLRDEKLPVIFKEVTHGRCKFPNYFIRDPGYPEVS